MLSSRRSSEDGELSRVCKGGAEEDDCGGENVAPMISFEDAIHITTESEKNRHVCLGGTDLPLSRLSSSFLSSGPDVCETKNYSYSCCKSSKLDVFQDASSNTPLSAEVEDKEDGSGMDEGGEQSVDCSPLEDASSMSTLENEKGGFNFRNVLRILRLKGDDTYPSLKSEVSSTQSEMNVPASRRETIQHSHSLTPPDVHDVVDDTSSRSSPNGRLQGFDFFNRLRFRRKSEKCQVDGDDIEDEQEPIDTTTTTTNRDVDEGDESDEDLSSINSTGSFSPTQFINSGDYSKHFDGSFQGVLAEVLKSEVAINIVIGSLSHPLFSSDIEHLWGTESNIWKPEARKLLETWCEPCGFCPNLMLSSIIRCLRGRRKLRWPKKILTRSIIDTLFTRTFQLLPNRDMYGRCILVTTLRSLDYERCPHDQYKKCLSYLLQDAANNQSGTRRSIADLGTFPSCNELVIVIDIKGLSSPWERIVSLLDKILGIKYKQGVGGERRITQWTMPEGHSLCDPALSYFPLVLSRVVVVNAGPIAKTTLAARRRVFHNSNYCIVHGSSKGRRNSGKLENNNISTRKQTGHLKEGDDPCQLPIVFVSSEDDWIEVIGDEGVQALPVRLGGNVETSSINFELNHRIRMEDLPQGSVFISDMERFMQLSYELSHVSSNEAYVNCLKRALQQMSITVPVMWVRQSLGDLEEASLAKSAAWHGRHGKSVREDLVQLQKDVVRDEIFIDEVPETTGDTIDALHCRIKAVAEEGGLKIADVQQQLAARDILLSSKRTTAGGDVWVCIDMLCRNRDLVVICPISEDADGLQINVEYVPSTPDVDIFSSPKLLDEEDKRPSSLQVERSSLVGLETEGSKSLMFLSVNENGLVMSHDPTQKLNEETLKSQAKKGLDLTGGFVNVSAKTKMIFKICAENPLDGCSLLTISCTYYRYFSVGPEGLVDGAEPNHLSPLVIISCDQNGVPE